MILALIAAVAENGVIGRDNDLPWRLPADLKHFKRTTKGHPTVMGRRTWESIGCRPLPGRTAVVVTRQADYRVPEGVHVVPSLDEALERAAAAPGGELTFVIGGAGVYQEALSRADRLYLTRIRGEVEGNVHFPPWNPQDWIVTEEEVHLADEAHAWDLVFTTLERR